MSNLENELENKDIVDTKQESLTPNEKFANDLFNLFQGLIDNEALIDADDTEEDEEEEENK